TGKPLDGYFSTGHAASNNTHPSVMDTSQSALPLAPRPTAKSQSTTSAAAPSSLSSFFATASPHARALSSPLSPPPASRASAVASSNQNVDMLPALEVEPTRAYSLLDGIAARSRAQEKQLAA